MQQPNIAIKAVFLTPVSQENHSPKLEVAIKNVGYEMQTPEELALLHKRLISQIKEIMQLMEVKVKLAHAHEGSFMQERRWEFFMLYHLGKISPGLSLLH